MSWSVNRTVARREDIHTGRSSIWLPTSFVLGLILSTSWSLLTVSGTALAKKPDNPGGGEEDLCPDGSITYQYPLPSPPGTQRVDVFKDDGVEIVYIASTNSIACALTGDAPSGSPNFPRKIVPDPLDGDYLIECQTGDYNGIMRRTKQGNPSRGILINKQTHNPTIGPPEGTQFTLTLRAAPGADVMLGSAGSERPSFRLAVVSPADFTTIDGLKVSNAISGIGVQPGDPSSDGIELNNVTIQNCVVSDAGGPVTRGIYNFGHTEDHDLQLLDNQIMNCGHGILFQGGRDACVINGNDISNCDVGISLRGSVSINRNFTLTLNTISDCTTGVRLAKVRSKGKTYMNENTTLMFNTISASGAGAVCIDVEEPDPFFPDVGNSGVVIDSNNNLLCVANGAATGLWGNVVASSLSDWQTISGQDANSDDVCP